MQPFLGRGFFSPSGKHYVLASQVDIGKPIERLFAVPSGKELCRLPPLAFMRNDGESARPIAFSADEKLVALLSQDNAIHLCETATGNERQRLALGLAQGVRGRLAANIAFSRDSKLLATWIGSLYGQESFDNSIVVWDLATSKEALRVRVDPFFRIQFTWSPDSRTLAVTGPKGIRLWEVSTVDVRRELAGHTNVRALAFSPDGRLLATGSGDSTVLIWDIALPDGFRAATPPAGGLAKRWQALAEDDAARAYAAIRSLAAQGKNSVAWIRDKVKAAQRIDNQQVEKLIAQLNDDQFKVRQKATAELLAIGERVVPALDKALSANPTLETSLRLHDVRKRLTAMVLKGNRLQLFRAVEVLELIGTSDAAQVLAALAQGAPGALATTQAQAALRRLQDVGTGN